MKRAYVTGAGGMLGKALVPVFSDRYRIRATDIDDCDIREDAIIDDIRSFEPDIVFHLASMTDVDRCELEPDEAFRSNTLGTRNVALACSGCDAVMVYISTGMIYNGLKRYPYIEYDKPDPVCVYGKTKYEGELEIRKLLKKYYIINTCWAFGGGPEDKKFVHRMMELAAANSELRVVDDKFGSPTYTADLSRALYRIVESAEYGRYHCVNKGCVSRFEIASEIVRISGIKGCTVVPVSSEEFPLPAPRPRMEAMKNYNLMLMGLDLMRDWREALEEYITTTLKR